MFTPTPLLVLDSEIASSSALSLGSRLPKHKGELSPPQARRIPLFPSRRALPSSIKNSDSSHSTHFFLSSWRGGERLRCWEMYSSFSYLIPRPLCYAKCSRSMCGLRVDKKMGERFPNIMCTHLKSRLSSRFFMYWERNLRLCQER